MNNEIIKFLSEILMLKRNQREGWRRYGIENVNSLADHIACASQIAFIIGELEGLDGNKCSTIALFHDNGETRITDQHRIAKLYGDKKTGEEKAIKDQLKTLPEKIKNKINGILKEYNDRNTPESIVAKDADLVEAAIQAKVFSEQGYQNMDHWIKDAHRSVKTKTAKKILAEVKKTKDFTTCWWHDLIIKN